MIKNLRTYNDDVTDKSYSVTKKGIAGFLKGAAKGAGVAGTVNTLFPALIPTFAAMITGASEMSLGSKIAIGFGLASSPAVQISGLGIIGIGAAAGAVLGGAVSLVKGAVYKHAIKSDSQGKTR